MKLDDIEARAKAATPGPHRAQQFDTYWWDVVCDDPEFPALSDYPTQADATFWAAARDDVPWLCERLREALELLVEDTLRMGPEAFDAPQPAGMSRKELTAWQRERKRETRIRALLAAVSGKDGAL